MKNKGIKLLSVGVLTVGLALSSCSSDCKEATEKTNETITKLENEQKMNKETLENNKEVALSLSKAIMTGKWEEVNNILSDDFVYIGDGRPAMNKQEYIGFMQGVLSVAFTDMDMKFLRVIGEGDMVAIDYTNTMTQVGDWYGVPATNKRVVGSGQFMRQIKDGKVVAEWQTTNGAGLMMQLTAK